MAATLFPSIRESPNKMRKWDACVRLRGSRASRVAAALAGLRVLRLSRRTLSRGRGGPTPNQTRTRAQCWPPHQQALAGSHSEAGSLRQAAGCVPVASTRQACQAGRARSLTRSPVSGWHCAATRCQ